MLLKFADVNLLNSVLGWISTSGQYRHFALYVPSSLSILSLLFMRLLMIIESQLTSNQIAQYHHCSACERLITTTLHLHFDL